MKESLGVYEGEKAEGERRGDNDSRSSERRIELEKKRDIELQDEVLIDAEGPEGAVARKAKTLT